MNRQIASLGASWNSMWPVLAIGLTLLAGSLGQAGAASEAYESYSATDSIVWDVVSEVTAEVLAQEGESVDSETQQRLASWLAGTDFDFQSEDRIGELGRVAADALLTRQSASLIDMASQLSERLHGFYFDRNGDDGIALGMMLFPYLQEAGLCRGEAASEDGISCTFTFGSDGVDAVGYSGGVSVPRVESSSTLGQALQTALIGPTAVLSDLRATNQAAAANWTGPGDIPIETQYAYYYQWKVSCSTSCRAAIIGYGAIRGKYLFVGSDSVTAAAAGALYCSFSCTIGTIWASLNGRDGIAYALNTGDRRVTRAQTSSKAVHAVIPACGLVMAPKAASVGYIALQNADFELPYDIGVDIEFGTYYQRKNLNALTAPVASTFVEPEPTLIFTSPLGDDNWQSPSQNLPLVPRVGHALGAYAAWLALAGFEYQFNDIYSWRFNIMFAAVNKVNALDDACFTTVPLRAFGDYWAPGTVQGSQFWYWRGGWYYGDYGFPEIFFAAGF